MDVLPFTIYVFCLFAILLVLRIVLFVLKFIHNRMKFLIPDEAEVFSKVIDHFTIHFNKHSHTILEGWKN